MPKEQSGYALNGSIINFPESSLHELLRKRATIAPSTLALQYGEERINYGALQERIDQMAHYLWSEGVRPGQRIAISLERSPDLIISLFAILQCGAAYIPIDTNYPDKRLQFMIADAEAEFFIYNSSKKKIPHETKSIFIEDALKTNQNTSINLVNQTVSPDSPACIIYTSGSTGRPKGVQVTHRNVVNLVHSMGEEPGINASDKVFAITTISFDVMIIETFLPLLHGACVVIVDDQTRRDGELLLKIAKKEGITLMWGTPSIWQILLDAGWEKSLTLRALIGGEAVPLALAQNLISKCREVWNIYGPTETTVALLTKITEKDDPITIGKPIANAYIYLLDKNGNPVAPGEIGEIAIGGAGVSLGYLNRAELTVKRFIPDPFQEGKNSKIYLSGDLGKLLPNGQVQCLGRIDNQVKVRGHRIELDGIETVLHSLTEVSRATVIVSDHLTGEPQLVAYLKSSRSDEDTETVRKQLADILPDYMVPSIFMWVQKFPITQNGKVDKKNLPLPKYIRPDSAPLFRKPRTPLEIEIAALWAEQLQIPKIGIDDNFFLMGGTSLLTQKVASLLKKRLNLNVPVTKIYQFPTIATLSDFLEADAKNASAKASPVFSEPQQESSTKDVAIIGMAGRFPGANSIKELWEILKEGKETTRFFTAEEVDTAIPETLKNDPLYVKARGVVPSAKAFDATFFGINPKLAEAMDPQQRLFLEIAWETLEQTGHLPRHYQGKIGVYAGSGTNTYYKNNVLPNKELIDQVGQLQADTVNEKDYIAPRAAYHLNLNGPAVSVHSACSTSLLAVAEAVEAIRNGQCDAALAGGSSITAPMHSGHLYQEGSILSADGHCRSFDASGTGTVFSDGAGVVLLKNLSAAEKDGDEILGVIKGVGINNDGGNKGSFTAPSTQGQADTIKSALRNAQVAPSEISYIEAHGTATPLGDPIEIEGLKTAFGEQENKNYCALGSIKSNMGHLTAAAGVAGLIKTILAVKHKQIPPSLGFEKPNPAIDFENSPFYVNNKLQDWNVDDLRKAGVSSFGVGGTNVHIVLEEYPEKTKKPSTPGRKLQLLTWSAKTETSREGYQTALGNYLKKAPDKSLADVAYSLNVTRDSFNHRSFLISESQEDASKNLHNPQNNSIKTAILKAAPGETVFLFPGQGAQFPQMARELYENEKYFREAVDECAELLMDDLECDIRNIIYPKTSETENRLQNTQFTQPALFVTEYALAKLWMSWGIRPKILCGHSIGEFVAAHLAGIFNLKDALHLIAVRGRLVSELPQGSMLSVRLGTDDLREMLPENLSIAAANSDTLSVVAGTTQDINAFAKALKERDIPNMPLPTSHAFHSAMMDPVLPAFKKEVEQVQRNAPQLPLISTVTGTWLTDTEATDPDYWAHHIRACVRFTDAAETLLEMEDPLLLEVGPGRSLTTLTRRKKEGKTLKCTPSLPNPKSDENAYHGILNALGELWSQGLEPDWPAFYDGQNRQKVALPSYVFDRKPCWIDPPKKTADFIQKSPENTPKSININENSALVTMRKPLILQKISEIISNTSGIDLETSDYNHSFLELGLDSLILTQMALTCKKEFDLPITFRQLNEEFSTPEILANYLDENLPAEKFAPKIQDASAPKGNGNIASESLDLNFQNTGDQNSALSLITQQLQLLGKQVALLQGGNTIAPRPQTNGHPVNQPTNLPTPETDTRTEDEKTEHKKPFGASPKIERQSNRLDENQQHFLKELTSRYNQKTAESKAYTQKHRAQMADPRVVSGFKPLTKELVYPLVIGKSAGNRLWDLDGNEYIDALNGFGSCLFGHQPDFIKEALHDQIERGYEVGPQHPLAGEVCELLCEFTGHDRAALCNTGSEAVLGAMRIARTATGRSLIVAFSGAYHGINDEAIVRGSRRLKTFPAAAGIQPETVQNMLILDYGTEESLNIIRDRAHELAAVLVEPVQSRRPEFQPVDFLKEVRKITTEAGSTLIFDEVITGFRMHPGGAQALFGITADVAAYGKVFGGGMPVGAIMGKKEYMDALDGGFWQYGDDSFPEVGVTYFAGTFVRHPLALAATKASLNHMKERGHDLQKQLTEMTEHLALELNIALATRKLPMQIVHFVSLWRLKFLEDIPHSELLFVLMREKGIHILDGFPCFLTMSYTEEDIDKLIHAFTESIDKLITAGFFPSKTLGNEAAKTKSRSSELNTPPIPGARLGTDESGNPAWFIANAQKEGEYVKIEL